jgi:hypothetical protein
VKLTVCHSDCYNSRYFAQFTHSILILHSIILVYCDIVSPCRYQGCIKWICVLLSLFYLKISLIWFCKYAYIRHGGNETTDSRHSSLQKSSVNDIYIYINKLQVIQTLYEHYLEPRILYSRHKYPTVTNSKQVTRSQNFKQMWGTQANNNSDIITSKRHFDIKLNISLIITLQSIFSS